MALEDRRYHRTQINYEDTDERFHIEVYDSRYVLNRIHDVSVSGTGIQIPNAIEPGTPIKLVFRSHDTTISVNGTTVWCNSIPLGFEAVADEFAYRTGIQFDPKDRNCGIFFTALKEFLRKQKNREN